MFSKIKAAKLTSNLHVHFYSPHLLVDSLSPDLASVSRPGAISNHHTVPQSGEQVLLTVVDTFKPGQKI